MRKLITTGLLLCSFGVLAADEIEMPQKIGLRDYFAGQIAINQYNLGDHNPDEMFVERAAHVYRLADFLVAASSASSE